MLLFLSFSYVCSASIEKDNILFTQISNKQGLSHNTVFDISQDSLGYLWFATKEGLNRYDGNKFDVYLPDSDDNTSLISNQVKTLFVDNKGKLYIGGNRGLSIYNDINNTFTNYPILSKHSEQNITDIKQDDDGNIWVSTHNGDIYKLNLKNNKFEYNNVSKLMSSINSICMLKNSILIGGNDGLFLFNYQTEEFKKIDLQKAKVNINSIIKGKNSYWIATEGNGIYRLNNDFELEQNIKHIVSDDNSLSNDNVRSLEWDSEGNLWIGTFVGLNILNVETYSFTNIFKEFGKPYSLSQNSVRSLYSDKQGGMWLGTFFGGINYYHKSNIKFDLINQNGGDFSLNDNVISDIKEDDKGNFWIATNDNGLNFWNTKKREISYFIHDERNTNSLSSNNIKSIEFASDNRLFIGTHKSGLNYFSPLTRRNLVFKHTDNPKSIANNSVYAILKDSRNKIWIGTWKGLDSFDPICHEFYHYHTDKKGNKLSSELISFLFEDSRKRIWIGTFDGLNIYYPEKNLFETFKHSFTNENSLSSNEITSIIEDSKGRIWIGTRNGLNIFDELNRSFLNYTTKDGLANNSIYGIIEDDKGNLWISSNSGLSCFNHKTKKVKNFDLNDGIQALQFNNYSYCKAQDGRFLFGGINGISIFNPNNISEVPFNSDILISNLKVLKQNVLVGDESGILNDALNNSKEIKLKYNQNAFSLNYTAINFISTTTISFKYMLEGFDKQWQEGNSTRKIEYSNISTGTYVLKIKAIGSDGIKHDNIKKITIIVNKAWMYSYWAISIYILLFCFICFVLLRFLKERINTKNQLRIERLEKKQLTEINKLKIQFFTNISHEFRTPLTLIISPLQKILERSDNRDWLNKQHRIMYKSANRLLSLIDQLLDFRKSELGQLQLRVSKDNIVGFLKEIYLSFAGVANQNNIIYTFDSHEDDIEIYFDKSYVEKIAYNLLSNAFKYTPKGETISLELSVNSEYFILQCKDSGKGIPEDKINFIFDRYYRVDENSSKTGSGIGLAFTKRLIDLHYGDISVFSEENKGSVFTVRIPISHSIYSSHELVKTDRYDDVEKKNNYIQTELIYEKPNEKSINKDFTILIVEDNKDISDYLHDNLKLYYNIKLASNGKEALDLMQIKLPDLIISDLMMPIMDGAKFCKTVKKNIKTCHIPLILLTAKSSLEDEINGLEIGADDYMAKPFAMSLLEAKISNIIKTQARLKEYYSLNSNVEPNKMAFNSLDEELLTRSIKIIESNLSETNMSVDFFAKEMGMSRSNLHLKLKAITGESASDFIKKIQFSKAKKLIAENRYSVAEISFMVGFNSPSYFSTSFKKYFGYLPSEYLEKCKRR